MCGSVRCEGVDGGEIVEDGDVMKCGGATKSQQQTVFICITLRTGDMEPAKKKKGGGGGGGVED